MRKLSHRETEDLPRSHCWEAASELQSQWSLQLSVAASESSPPRTGQRLLPQCLHRVGGVTVKSDFWHSSGYSLVFSRKDSLFPWDKRNLN